MTVITLNPATSLRDIEREHRAEMAADIDLLYGQIRMVARSAEYLAKHGKVPVFYYREPRAGDTLGEIVVVERPADLPQGCIWRLFNPHTPPKSMPWADMYLWLRSAVDGLPLIRSR